MNIFYGIIVATLLVVNYNAYQRDMKVCELTHSHGVCVDTLR